MQFRGDILKKMIYLVDDEENICALIKSFLEKDGFIVKSFNIGSDLLQEFYKTPADLVILDVMLQDIDGITICSLLRKLSSVPIIIVSALGSEIDKVTAINIGCDDYITKPFSPLELLARIKAIFRRIDLDQVDKTSPANLTFGNLIIDERKRIATIDGEEINFTPTELSLIIYLIKNSNRAISRHELLRKIWNFNSDTIDTRATDDTVKRLRKKLLLFNANITIQTLRGYGFRIIQNDSYEK